MPELNVNLDFLKKRPVQIVTLLLLLQAAAFHALSFGESAISMRPLSAFSISTGSWQMAQEGYVEERTLQVLKADDVLSRIYSSPKFPLPASLFVAYFKTQRTGRSPHSPKNCLPGSGWVPESSETRKIFIPQQDQTISVNRYIVAKGTDRTLVYYWYQSPHHVVANEYMAKIYLVLDAFRYNRTDTALVRVLVPLGGGSQAGAESAAEDFIRGIYPQLKAYLPS